MKYVRDLSKSDDKVMSVSPQESKENRPFVGIVVVMNDKKYCVPLTSPKPKHARMKNDVDFSKMYDTHNKFIGALNFNNMIPVSSDCINLIDVKPNRNDSPKDKLYKDLLNNQLDWCNDNYENIIKKANKLYKTITQTPEKSRNLTRRCCDFKKLETVLEKWISRHSETHVSTSSLNSVETRNIIPPAERSIIEGEIPLSPTAKFHIIVNMDGILTDTTDAAGAECAKSFSDIRPRDNIIDAIKALSADRECELFVVGISRSPDNACEKLDWLDMHLPEIDTKHRIIYNSHSTPALLPFSEHKNCVLWDCSNDNLIEWEERGGISVKCIHDNTTSDWNGKFIKSYFPSEVIIDMLVSTGNITQQSEAVEVASFNMTMM